MCVPGQRSGGPAAAAVAALRELAAVDPAALTAAERAQALADLERVSSVYAAAHARILATFTAAGDCEDDGHGSPRTWLTWQTRVSRASASASLAQMRRLRAHPAIADALAAAEITVSYARAVCDWSDLLPLAARADADLILLAAARSGADLAGLSSLFEEIRARTARPDSDGPEPADRGLYLRKTYGGAARLTGDLTPECAAALEAVIESLGKRGGPYDMRARWQRDHDALADALTRLIASGMLPDRAGQPVQIQLHMTLADLLRRSGETAAGSEPPLPGPAAPHGAECDAQIVPVVTGTIDPEVLDRLARRLAGRGSDEAMRLIDEHAIALLSGPGRLASLLRTGTLRGPAASVSLPLDLGRPTATIPPHLRRAVIVRDRHCAAPGCDAPPAACDVHHIRPRAQGGKTKLTNLLLLCRFHHLIAVHQWGWTISLNHDGTTTMTSPDGQRSYHSHSPPRYATA